MMGNNVQVRIEKEALESFCREVFLSLELSEEDADMAAEVLVTADLRGQGWRIQKTGVCT